MENESKIYLELRESEWVSFLDSVTNKNISCFPPKSYYIIKENLEKQLTRKIETARKYNTVLEHRMKDIKTLEEKTIAIMLDCFENKMCFLIDLDPVELLLLHGIIILARRHPEFKESRERMERAGSILSKIEKQFSQLGFDDSEIDQMRAKELD